MGSGAQKFGVYRFVICKTFWVSMLLDPVRLEVGVLGLGILGF